MHLWIGIDGGATKTRVVAVGEDGVVIAEGLAGATNYRIVGVDAACLHLQQAMAVAHHGHEIDRLLAQLVLAGCVRGK